MNIRRLFIATISALFLTACEKPIIDYVQINEIVLENNSSHDIVINRDGTYTQAELKEIIIKASKSEVLAVVEASIEHMFDKKCIITFGNKVTADYNSIPKSKYHFMYFDNCEFVSFKKATTRRKYTFTDADYQYALEHGTLIE